MNENDFYNEAVFVGKGGYYKGNTNYQCVNYAIGRSTELSNKAITYYSGISKKEDIEKPLMNRSGYGNAIDWLNDTLWEKGTEPKLGAIMVYGSNYGSGLGHVRIVEKIEGNKLFISGANENKSMAFKWINIPSITSNGFLGYIYNPYVKEESMENLIKFELDKDNYDYKWSVDGNKYGEDFDITTERGFADLELEKQGWELLLKVNGSLFYEYDKAHFACGLEKSRGVNNQDVSMSCVSDYNDCMAIAGVGEELYFAAQKWIIDKKLDESYCAITGLGLILDGKKRNDLHKGFESQWNTKSGRTVIGEDKYGNPMSYSFAGETGKSGLTGSQLQDKCLELGFHNAILLDGGGSVFRQYRNDQNQLVYDISSSRKVKNALLLYRKRKDVIDNSLNKEYEELNNKYNELKNTNEVVLKANQELKEKYDSLEKEHSLTLESINHLKESVLNAIKTIEDILNE